MEKSSKPKYHLLPFSITTEKLTYVYIKFNLRFEDSAIRFDFMVYCKLVTSFLIFFKNA